MKIESSAPTYIPAITKNRATGELEMGKVNWTELMEKARLTRDAELQQLAYAKKTLLPEEIDSLAEKLYKKYDPHNMTQDIYNRFIDDLINGGALIPSEACGLGGRYGITVDPFAPGGLMEVLSPSDRVGSLSDANGDAIEFLRAMQKWSQADTDKDVAIKKAFAVLDAILKRREDAKLMHRNNDPFSFLI